jgi:hypothetical protein
MQILKDSSQRLRTTFKLEEVNFCSDLLHIAAFKKHAPNFFARLSDTILYPDFDFYPGGSTDAWWQLERLECLFYLRFRLRRKHFLTLMDELEQTGKYLKCEIEKHAFILFERNVCYVSSLSQDS